MKVPSKYCHAHYEDVRLWLGERWVSFINSIPRVSALTTDKKFIFICGCGHTGTTLASGRLGNHSNVHLIARETGVFLPHVGAMCAKRVAMEWDYFASINRKDFIVEKTPKHVHAISRIVKVLPEAKIILMTRNPLDCIASLYKRFGSFQVGTSRWIVDTKATIKALKYPNTMLVKYEDLTNDPKNNFERITEFCGLDWQDTILDSGSTGYDSIVQKENMIIRAAQISAEIHNNTGGWESVLTDKEYRQVVSVTSRLAKKLNYQNYREGKCSA